MNRKDENSQKIISLILFAFSLFYLLSCFKYKLGTHKIVGAGFLPLVIGLLLVICSSIHIVRVFRGRPADKECTAHAEEGKNYRAIIGILVCTAAYPLMLGYLKFVTSTFLAGFAMLVLLKSRSITLSFVLSVFMAVGCFLLFSRLFGVALPGGPLEALLFRIGS